MKRIIGWIAVLGWIIVIFSFSSQVANESNNLSTNVTEIVVETVHKVVPDKEFDIVELNHYIRKNAHFFLYLILGLLLMNALNENKSLLKKYIIAAILMGGIVASSDEFHQGFIPGRGPGIKDVFIDISGLFLGVIIYSLLIKKYKENF